MSLVIVKEPVNIAHEQLQQEYLQTWEITL